MATNNKFRKLDKFYWKRKVADEYMDKFVWRGEDRTYWKFKPETKIGDVLDYIHQLIDDIYNHL